MLEVKDLFVKRGAFVMKDINLNVRDGEYFVILGPTGAGKTALFESIAGLKPIERGQILINGKDVTDLSLEQRKIGITYQDYAIYGHLSVRDNISFGLIWKGKKRKEIENAIDKVVELLDIADLLLKRPLGLSGGESQKICLARAIAIKPELLLLDEPLSSIDPHGKDAQERKLKEVHNHLGLTTLHITHNFEEAMALGDRIAVMVEGRIAQLGTPHQIFRHPNSKVVAQFLMARNVFEGEASDSAEGQSVFCTEGVKLAVDTTLQGRLHASIRPEDIAISREPLYSNTHNSLQATVTHISDRGAVVYVTVNVPPEFTCLILPRSLEEMGLRQGQKVFITFEVSAVNVF